MTTTYTLRIPVQAWRVASDGSLPEEAREAVKQRGTTLVRRTGDRTDYVMEYYVRWRELVPDLPIPDCHYDEWRWWDEGTSTHYKAIAGDWIVCHEYGCEAMTDEDFRACCEEVEES